MRFAPMEFASKAKEAIRISALEIETAPEMKVAKMESALQKMSASVIMNVWTPLSVKMEGALKASIFVPETEIVLMDKHVKMDAVLTILVKDTKTVWMDNLVKMVDA